MFSSLAATTTYRSGPRGRRPREVRAGARTERGFVKHSSWCQVQGCSCRVKCPQFRTRAFDFTGDAVCFAGTLSRMSPCAVSAVTALSVLGWPLQNAGRGVAVCLGDCEGRGTSPHSSRTGPLEDQAGHRLTHPERTSTALVGVWRRAVPQKGMAPVSPPGRAGSGLGRSLQSQTEPVSSRSCALGREAPQSAGRGAGAHLFWSRSLAPDPPPPSRAPWTGLGCLEMRLVLGSQGLSRGQSWRAQGTRHTGPSSPGPRGRRGLRQRRECLK